MILAVTLSTELHITFLPDLRVKKTVHDWGIVSPLPLLTKVEIMKNHRHETVAGNYF